MAAQANNKTSHRLGGSSEAIPIEDGVCFETNGSRLTLRDAVYPTLPSPRLPPVMITSQNQGLRG
jgi:hypothetical protein